ncbi:uncharacterized protein KY384_001637 [Bacidia gigantensis]|uniref:uncharacterized protein n=1 Tax=Bacidia gigantensis TaxID=2732470 RepID=UPI001D04D6AA|nr:uncharacterized protein KY384_001637 [Bacidia gigantensis]KAG8533896.1 hypothetical protein KY384_001637 [Bacidia gigantensis]
MAKLKTWLKAKVGHSQTSKSPKVAHVSAAYARAQKGYLLQENDIVSSQPVNKITVPTTTPEVQNAVVEPTVWQPHLEHTATSQDDDYACTARSEWPLDVFAEATAGLSTVTPEGASPGPDLVHSKPAKVVESNARKARKLIQQHGRSSQSAILWAIEERQTRSTAILLDHGLLNAEPALFCRCLHLCLQRGDTNLFTQVLAVAESSAFLGHLLEYEPNLQIVAANVDADRLLGLLQKLNPYHRQRVLYTALESEKTAVLKALLWLGMDANTCYQGHSILSAAIWRRNRGFVSILLDHPTTDVNALGMVSLEEPCLRPPLEVALRLNDPSMTEMVLACPSIELNKADHNGDTALIAAARQNCPQLVRTLLGKGADVNVLSRYGNTALQWCATHDDPVTLKLLLDHGAHTNIADDDGNAALHLAAMRNRPQHIRLLIERGADIKTINKKDETVLHLAVKPKATQALGILLDMGAHRDLAGKDGNTALHVAAKFDCPNAIKVLLEKGANPLKKNKDGKQPIHVAGDEGHVICFNLFRQHAGLKPLNSNNRPFSSDLYPDLNIPNTNPPIKLTFSSTAGKPVGVRPADVKGAIAQAIDYCERQKPFNFHDDFPRFPQEWYFGYTKLDMWRQTQTQTFSYETAEIVLKAFDKYIGSKTKNLNLWLVTIDTPQNTLGYIGLKDQQSPYHLVTVLIFLSKTFAAPGLTPTSGSLVARRDTVSTPNETLAEDNLGAFDNVFQTSSDRCQLVQQAEPFLDLALPTNPTAGPRSKRALNDNQGTTLVVTSDPDSCVQTTSGGLTYPIHILNPADLTSLLQDAKTWAQGQQAAGATGNETNENYYQFCSHNLALSTIAYKTSPTSPRFGFQEYHNIASTLLKQSLANPSNGTTFVGTLLSSSHDPYADILITPCLSTNDISPSATPPLNTNPNSQAPDNPTYADSLPSLPPASASASPVAIAKRSRPHGDGHLIPSTHDLWITSYTTTISVEKNSMYALIATAIDALVADTGDANKAYAQYTIDLSGIESLPDAQSNTQILQYGPEPQGAFISKAELLRVLRPLMRMAEGEGWRTEVGEGAGGDDGDAFCGATRGGGQVVGRLGWGNGLYRFWGDEGGNGGRRVNAFRMVEGVGMGFIRESGGGKGKVKGERGRVM